MRTGILSLRAAAAAVVLVAVGVCAAAFGVPRLNQFLRSAGRGEHLATAEDHALALTQALRAQGEPPPGVDHAHDEHEHDHGPGEADSIRLSAAALQNIGLTRVTLARGNYVKTVSMPGMVVERPGRTQLNVAASLGGVITRVYVIPGEAVAPRTPLFDIRLTHEELVSAQGEYLKTLEELDVVNHEIARLEAIAEGLVPGHRVRDERYRRRQLEANLRAQRQALLLHGLSEADADNIVQTRVLLQSLTIQAPQHEDDAACEGDHLFHVQSLAVQRGQQVDAGAPLCVLADHCELYLEGTAFEQDAARIRTVAERQLPIAAHQRLEGGGQEAVEGLKLLYIADQIEPESRALHFYVTLPNSIVLDRMEGGRRFQQWKYKPGQRLELQVPVESWEERIVAPAESVITEGAEAYVYVEAAPGHFHRTPVHLEHRDQQSAVIAPDSAVKVGDTIAGRGAFQIHLALRNRTGGSADAHGHSH